MGEADNGRAAQSPASAWIVVATAVKCETAAILPQSGLVVRVLLDACLKLIRSGKLPSCLEDTQGARDIPLDPPAT